MVKSSLQSNGWGIFRRIIILDGLILLLSWQITQYSRHWSNGNIPLYVSAIIIFILVYPVFYYMVLTRESESMKLQRYVTMVASGVIVFTAGVAAGSAFASSLAPASLVWPTGVALLAAIAGGVIYHYLYDSSNSRLHYLLYIDWDIDELLEGLGWHACLLLLSLLFGMRVSNNVAAVAIATAVAWSLLRIAFSIEGLVPSSPKPGVFCLGVSVLAAAVGYILIPYWWSMAIGVLLSAILLVIEMNPGRPKRDPVCHFHRHLSIY